MAAIGTIKTELSHHELMRRGHRGIQQLWDLDAPVIVAAKGWVMGGSFQRALLCDIRIAAEGTRFRLPELTYGVIPDTGGVAVLYEMCGARGGQRPGADRAHHGGRGGAAHGIVSRVVPADELDATVHARWPSRSRPPRRHGEDGPRGDPPPVRARRSGRPWPTR